MCFKALVLLSDPGFVRLLELGFALRQRIGLGAAVIDPANPAEAITSQQAVQAYTAGSAYAEFAEKDKGTLAVGKLADLVVLSQDIFAVPPPELPKTTSLLTIVGGKIVHDAKVLK